jgi:hypothetical protein
VFHFCSGCGERVASGVAVVARDPAAISNTIRWGIFAATAILPVVGVAMGAMYVVDARVEQKRLGVQWLVAGIAFTLVYAALLAWL